MKRPTQPPEDPRLVAVWDAALEAWIEKRAAEIVAYREGQNA